MQMILFLINGLLALIGLWLSWRIYRKKRSPHKNICIPGYDCEQVLFSKFSKLFGIDIENIGFVYYGLLLLGYLGYVILGQAGSGLFLFLLLLLSITGLAFSLYLLFVQAFYIKNWCVWCVSSSITSILIFIVSVISFSGSAINVGEVLSPGISILMTLQLIAIAVGVSSATVSGFMTIKFLKDFKIDQGEDKKLMLVNQIIWAALMTLLLVNVCFYLINPESYMATASLKAQLFVLLIVIINNAILSLHVGPKINRHKS